MLCRSDDAAYTTDSTLVDIRQTRKQSIFRKIPFPKNICTFVTTVLFPGPGSQRLSYVLTLIFIFTPNLSSKWLKLSFLLGFNPRYCCNVRTTLYVAPQLSKCILQHVTCWVDNICVHNSISSRCSSHRYWQDDLQRAIPRGDFRALGLHGRGIPDAVI